MLDIWNLEWVNHNSVRAYPLSSDCSRANITNDFVLPDDVIVGMSISIAGNIETDDEVIDISKFYLSCVSITSKTATFEFSYNNTRIAQATCNFDTIGQTSIPTVVNLTSLNNVMLIGYVVLNNIATIINLPNGYWYFNTTGGQLDPDVIHTQPPGINKITVRTATGDVTLSNQEIILEGGDNITLSVDTSGDSPIITITGTQESEETIAKAVKLSGAVMSINGVYPEDGNINFVAGECMCITADPAGHAIYFSETCSKPCCGCDDLDVVKDKVKELNDVITASQSLMTTISNKMYFERKVLG